MGMGNYACSADTIKEEKVRELCPKKFEEFMSSFHDVNFSLLDFAQDYQYSYYKSSPCQGEKEFNTVRKLFEELCESFFNATKVENDGLYLGLTYHKAENRGDELDGVGWTVEGHRTWTPAGRKFKDDIITLTWTEFG